MESNYYTEIEAEFSRARGKQSLLAPLDWQLMQMWEKREIPLALILRSMSDVAKNFQAQNRKDSIKTLRYFSEEVEKRFAEWCKNQVGKSMEENEMKNQSFAESIAFSDDHAKYIEEKLLPHFDPRLFIKYEIKLPEPLCCAVPKVRANLLMLIEEINAKQPNIDAIESKLKTIAEEFETALVASFPHDQLTKMIEEIKKNYDKIPVTDQVLEKLLIRQLHQKYHFPELTLFAI